VAPAGEVKERALPADGHDRLRLVLHSQQLGVEPVFLLKELLVRSLLDYPALFEDD